jgi:hypothetical protein
MASCSSGAAYAADERWTRHPQLGNCKVPNRLVMFTQVNIFRTKRLRFSVVHRYMRVYAGKRQSAQRRFGVNTLMTEEFD